MRKILILEDDVQARDAIKKTLEEEGYEVDAFNSIYAAALSLYQNAYDLLILDYVIAPFRNIDECRINEEVKHRQAYIEKIGRDPFYKGIETEDLLEYAGLNNYTGHYFGQVAKKSTTPSNTEKHVPILNISDDPDNWMNDITQHKTTGTYDRAGWYGFKKPQNVLKHVKEILR